MVVELFLLLLNACYEILAVLFKFLPGPFFTLLKLCVPGSQGVCNVIDFTLDVLDLRAARSVVLDSVLSEDDLHSLEFYLVVLKFGESLLGQSDLLDVLYVFVEGFQRLVQILLDFGQRICDVRIRLDSQRVEMLAKVCLLRLDSSLKHFPQLAAIDKDQTSQFLDLDVLANVDVPVLQLVEEVPNGINGISTSLEFLEAEVLHEGIDIVTILEGLRLFLQVLDVLAEAIFNVGLGCLVLETAVSNHLEARSSIRDEAVDVRLQLLLGVDGLHVLGGLLHVTEQLLEASDE